MWVVPISNRFRLGATIAVCLPIVLSLLPAYSQQPVTHKSAPEQTSGEVEARGGPTLQHRNPLYQLRPGDVLEVTFSFTPSFNQTLTVRPDGFVTLRELGDLAVSGLTVPEVAEQLRTAYQKVLYEPVLTVQLKDFERPYFIAGGEVARPGKYELRGHTTVTQAVELAGGLKESAKHSQVLLFRQASNEWVEVRKLDVKRLLQAKNLDEDVELRPGDMVVVPKNVLSKIVPFIPRPSMGLYVDPTRY
jgi:polysaccharide biosynthesis/export protein